MSEEPPFADLCRMLVEGPVYYFRDWPNPNVPDLAAGVYTVWKDDEFIYVGMSGQKLKTEHLRDQQGKQGVRRALYARLKSHADGRRGGDQFCLYVCDRYVIPHLSADELNALGQGANFLDRHTRTFIRQHLSYRFALTQDGETALALERHIQRGLLPVGKPIINPL